MRMYVTVPVADLRREPVEIKKYCIRDPLQQTQLRYGEPVDVIEVQGSWARIEAPRQQRFTTDRGWHSYPGWVKWNALTWTEIKQKPCLPGQMSSEWIKQAAKPFMGVPYFWGGCSPCLRPHGIERSGVDCSSLVYLLYAMIGVQIPRDAHDQWLKCQKISGLDLQAGDLVFTAPNTKPERYDHVMLFVENDMLLESSLTAGITRYVTSEEKLGQTLKALIQGAKAVDVQVTFGRV
ncbi:MAG: C40 family peptidase [Chlamydiales bacterium]|nr:C40 family peptidase [Chlamydiales bacterium]